MALTFIDHDGLKRRGIKFSSAQLWRKMKAGTFPKAVKLGDRTLAWIEKEVDDWSTDRVKEREADAA